MGIYTNRVFDRPITEKIFRLTSNVLMMFCSIITRTTFFEIAVYIGALYSVVDFGKDEEISLIFGTSKVFYT